MNATASVLVFAPDPLVTVTIELAPDGREEIHLHAGGQGFWIARMIRTLGVAARLVGPFGGETGAMARRLLEEAGISCTAVATAGSNGSYVHDRRSGRRVTVATMAPQVLSRHEVDDLYGATVTAGLDADVTVLAGSGPWETPVIAPGIYRRLAGDLRSNGVRVLADLSGEELTEALGAGVDVLKVSHEQIDDPPPEEPGEVFAAMARLCRAGAVQVVVSRAARPTLCLIEEGEFEVTGPALKAVDHRGGGDSLTAGIAAALARGESMTDAVRLGSAASTLNVTRRGLATGSHEDIERLVHHFELRPVRARL